MASTYDHAGGVTEDAVALGNLATADTITFRDLDLIDTHTATFTLKSSTSSAHLPGFADKHAATSARLR